MPSKPQLFYCSWQSYQRRPMISYISQMRKDWNLDSVGEQNLPPLNVSLWHEYSFRLILLKKLKIQSFSFTSSSTQGRKESDTTEWLNWTTAAKNADEGPVIEIELSSDTYRRTQARCGDQSPLCTQQTLTYQTLTFLWIAFLIFEVPNHCPQRPLVILAEGGI